MSPIAPLTFAAIIVVLGSLKVLAEGGGPSSLVFQLTAVAVCASASILIHLATRPKRPLVDGLTSSLALLIALCGYLLSALDYGEKGLSIEQWWSPGAVALTIVSLAPYLPVRRLVILGLPASIVCAAIAVMVFPAGIGPWSPASVFVIVLSAPLMALTASVFFVASVVPATQHMLEEQERLRGDATPSEDAASLAERDALALLTARVTPFIERLAATGTVTAIDRAVAGQLARRLRDDLITRANASWLDSLADGKPVVVMDPENRADAMNDAQKTALTGLITAILDAPDTASKSVLVELRGRANGATAVGVSMDLALPEGRRTMHLAPYYLTLKTAFEGLSWSEGRLMNMRFEVPPEER